MGKWEGVVEQKSKENKCLQLQEEMEAAVTYKSEENERLTRRGRETG